MITIQKRDQMTKDLRLLTKDDADTMKTVWKGYLKQSIDLYYGSSSDLSACSWTIFGDKRYYGTAMDFYIDASGTDQEPDEGYVTKIRSVWLTIDAESCMAEDRWIKIETYCNPILVLGVTATVRSNINADLNGYNNYGALTTYIDSKKTVYIGQDYNINNAAGIDVQIWYLMTEKKTS